MLLDEIKKLNGQSDHPKDNKITEVLSIDSGTSQRSGKWY